MKTLNTHNEEMEKKFDEELKNLHLIKSWVYEDCECNNDTPLNCNKIVKNFITNSHKQLYIKIAEGEINRLEEKLKTAEKFVPFQKIHYQSGIREDLLYWNNILQELNT